jgi:MerR family transcriptional regulator, copper efflux regulator
MKDEMLSGELARICGVSADTIRHYERVGVLPSAVRGANGYRRFPAGTADRVLLVRRAVAIGFSLAELADLLRERDRGAAPCRRVRKMAGEKLAELEQRIAELTAMRDEMKALVEQWDIRLAAAHDAEPAFLLQSLGIAADAHRRQSLEKVWPASAAVAFQRE